MSTKVRMQIGKTWLEVDSESAKEAVRELSEYAEVFSETKCGECGSQDVRPTFRQAKGYDFYEMTCLACGAKLGFGQTKDGNRLFPKRKDQDGGPIGKDGWHRYESQGQNEDRGQGSYRGTEF